MEEIELLISIKKYREDNKKSQFLLGANMYIDNIFKNLKNNPDDKENYCYNNKGYLFISNFNGSGYILINNELSLVLIDNYNMHKREAEKFIRKKLFIHFPNASGLIRFINYAKFK